MIPNNARQITIALFQYTVKSLIVNSAGIYNMQYVHASLLNSKYGFMDGLIPDVLSKYQLLFKVNTHDPDKPILLKL